MKFKSLIVSLVLVGVFSASLAMAQLAGTKRVDDNYWYPTNKKVQFGLPSSEIYYDGTNLVVDITTGGGKVSFPDGVSTTSVTADGSISIGSLLTPSTSITSDGTGDGELVLPINSVGGTEFVGHYKELILCGENAENGVTYFAPATAPFGGTWATPVNLGSVGCDALDNTTEATADAPISTLATKVHGMYCVTDGTLGAGESIVFTLRTAAGNAVSKDGGSSTLTCTISEATTACRTNKGTSTNIAAGATVAMSVTETSNNADDNAWCSVLVSFP